jgi:hypothetical protein
MNVLSTLHLCICDLCIIAHDTGISSHGQPDTEQTSFHDDCVYTWQGESTSQHWWRRSVGTGKLAA